MAATTYDQWSISDAGAGYLTFDYPHGWTVTSDARAILNLRDVPPGSKSFRSVTFSSGDARIEISMDHLATVGMMGRGILALKGITSSGTTSEKLQKAGAYAAGAGDSESARVFEAHSHDRLGFFTFYNELPPDLHGADSDAMIAEWTGRTGFLGLTKRVRGYRAALTIMTVCFVGIAACPESQWAQLAPLLKHCLDSVSIGTPPDAFGGSSVSINSGHARTEPSNVTPYNSSPQPGGAGTPTGTQDSGKANQANPQAAPQGGEPGQTSYPPQNGTAPAQPSPPPDQGANQPGEGKAPGAGGQSGQDQGGQPDRVGGQSGANP